MKTELKSLEILKKYKQVLASHGCTELDEAIRQLEDLEHYSYCTSGLYATDRPDLLKEQDHHWEINFWEGKTKSSHPYEKVALMPYVDETVKPAESYLVIGTCPPWDAEEHEMVRVLDNSESHKLLVLLEKYFGIPNRCK